MNLLPTEATQDSYTLCEIAKDLAQLCPPELGQEIMAIGSVGWGKADADSDIDMEFWVEKAPLPKAATAWLEKAGATDLIPDTDSGAEEVNIICRFQNVWLEASWRVIGDKERMLQAIFSGENIDRVHLLQVWNLIHAIQLRTTGILQRWQQKLIHYPDVVQERIIADAAAFWSFPHRVNMLWALARRQELLGLTIWLMADVCDALRVLFAINRRWEMDWKHLQQASQSLSIKPDRLVERVNKVFSASPLERRVEASMRLILDILELVPSSCDVSSAITNIRQSLRAHTSSILEE